MPNFRPESITREEAEKILQNDKAVHEISVGRADNKIIKGTMTMMYLSILENRSDTVSQLLSLGGHPNKVGDDATGDYPLHAAVVTQQSEICCNLLRCEADISLKNHKGESPVSLAVQHTPSSGIDILNNILLSCQDSYTITEALAGLSLSPSTPLGSFPSILQLCMDLNKWNLVEDMLDSRNSFSCENNNKEIIKKIISRHDDCFDAFVSKQKRTLMDLAVRSSNLKMIEVLLQLGASPNVKCGPSLSTAFHQAAYSKFENAVIQFEKEGDPGIINRSGESVVQNAIQSGCPTVCKSVLRKATIETIESLIENLKLKPQSYLPHMSYTLFHLIVESGNIKLVKHLINNLNYKNSVNRFPHRETGNTSIHTAASLGSANHFQIAKYLISEGIADCSVLNKENESPLLLATYNCPELVGLMICKRDIISRAWNTPISDKYPEGGTPLVRVAREFNNEQLIRSLTKIGAIESAPVVDLPTTPTGSELISTKTESTQAEPVADSQSGNEIEPSQTESVNDSPTTPSHIPTETEPPQSETVVDSLTSPSSNEMVPEIKPSQTESVNDSPTSPSHIPTETEPTQAESVTASEKTSELFNSSDKELQSPSVNDPEQVITSQQDDKSETSEQQPTIEEQPPADDMTPLIDKEVDVQSICGESSELPVSETSAADCDKEQVLESGETMSPHSSIETTDDNCDPPMVLENEEQIPVVDTVVVVEQNINNSPPHSVPVDLENNDLQVIDSEQPAANDIKPTDVVVDKKEHCEEELNQNYIKPDLEKNSDNNIHEEQEVQTTIQPHGIPSDQLDQLQLEEQKGQIVVDNHLEDCSSESSFSLIDESEIPSYPPAFECVPDPAASMFSFIAHKLDALLPDF